MDISRNLIDLMYLTNRVNMEKLNNIKEDEKLSLENKKKYKEKFFNLTNNIFNNIPIKNDTDNITIDLIYSFNNFFKKSVGYFEFLEKQEKIQQRYKDMEKKESKIKNIDINDLNINIMRKKKQVKTKDMTDFVKKKKRKNKKKMHIPKQLNK